MRASHNELQPSSSLRSLYDPGTVVKDWCNNDWVIVVSSEAGRRHNAHWRQIPRYTAPGHIGVSAKLYAPISGPQGVDDIPRVTPYQKHPNAVDNINCNQIRTADRPAGPGTVVPDDALCGRVVNWSKNVVEIRNMRNGKCH